MKLLVKGVKIIDLNSDFNNQICDVEVLDGQIASIATSINAEKGFKVFNGAGAIISPGFFDLNCMIGDPGLETKEDLETGTAAAKAGGFTAIAVLPTTKPVVQTKGEVAYLLNKAKGNLVEVYPIGAISQNLQGKELAEMFDMKNMGAVAFSDGSKANADDGFISRALQYALGFNALLMLHPQNKALAGKAQVNESANNTLLGMKGIPAIAEEMQISRDIFLASYHHAPVHISNISTAGAVALIRKAKKEGVKITCDVAAHQLVFTEDLINSFDSNYKVSPPLRGKADIKALLAGLKDGTIDVITSQHRPQETEFKNVEFEIASFGIIALQTVLPLLLEAGLNSALIMEKLALNPRKILKLKIPSISVNRRANFTVYNPDECWLYNQAVNFSKSSNSPLLGKKLKGKVKLVCNNNQYQFYE